MNSFLLLIIVSFSLALSSNGSFCYNNALLRNVSDSQISKDLQQGYKARVAEGAVVSLKYYPYNVYIFIRNKDGSNMGISCGGTIIDIKWILTAGHCLPPDVPYQNMRVHVGSKEKMKGKMYLVKKAIRHSDYKAFVDSSTEKLSYLYDYLLLELSKNLKYGQKVQKVVLGTKEDIVSGNTAIFTGFGSNVFPTSQQSVPITPNKFLHMAKFKIVSHSDCVRDYSEVQAYEFCAIGTGATSACPGDSGSPLIADTKNGTRFVGVLSSGCRNSEDGHVLHKFSSVPLVKEWIHNNTGI